MKAKLKKAFTLVEMLIVVIIIGILMSALLPRLKGAQERARDTARKANLSQISTALEMYFNDNGEYPNGQCATDHLTDILTPKYLSSIPSDPQSGRKTYWTKQGWCENWSYAYSPLKKNGATSWWAVILANIEAFGKVANYVLSGQNYQQNGYEFKPTVELVNNLDNRVCDNGVVYTGNNTPVTCNENVKEWKTKDNPRMVYVIFN